MKIEQAREVLKLRHMVSVDGIDHELIGQVEVRFDKMDFRTTFKVLSSMGDAPVVLAAISEMLVLGNRLGEDKLATWREENGFGKQGDLFTQPDDSE